jgi:hypothetical protein
MIGTKFCQYPGKRPLKEKFSQKQCYPKGDAKDAFWNELWWYRCGDNPGKFLTFAGAQVAPPTIFAPVGLNFDFQNFRVLGTAKSIQRQPATGTALLILGKLYKFFYDWKIFLAFSAMPFGTALLAPFALWLGRRSITFYLFLAIGTFFRVSFEKLSFTKF